MLPAPTTERWKPLRAGLVDMFYYDEEEFLFHDGRLLLRGNNGTGKSKVLALTLPFLLDGDLAAHRVEPDGDRQKRMEWNLLLGGRHPSPERLGYTWLEFGRRGDDGTGEFRTIGCGLKAVTGRGIARHWFFVTSQRPGLDLHLLPETRVPLTREHLREALGEHGAVYHRAADYRRAVDEALFSLGEHRYAALVDLLIQLRQPQLSKRPDERLLSRALTEALPPLDQSLISTVADAFRGLDEERDALRSLDATRQAAGDFLRHYERYAKAAAKRKARAPRERHSKYEHLGRDLVTAEDQHAAAEQALAIIGTELEALRGQRAALEARQRALQESPEMRSAERLDLLSQDAESKEADARARAEERGRQEGQAGRAAAKADRAAEVGGQRQSDLRAALADAGAAAARALLARSHAAATAGLAEEAVQEAARTTDAGAWAGAALDPARRQAETLVGRQDQAITELTRLLADIDKRAGALRTAQQHEGRLSGEVNAAADRLEAAQEAIASRAGLLLDAYRRYLAGLTELRVPDPDDVLGALEQWGITGAGPNPAARAIDDAAAVAGAELGRLRGELDAARRRHAERTREIEREIGRLRAGGHDAPPAPHTRAPGGRDGQPGAPLWKVIDFASSVTDRDKAGLEAALEAAGLLDAWVTPDGTLLDGDVTVVSGRAPVPGPSCATALAPAINPADPQASALPAHAVAAVLAAIGLGAGAGADIGTWVTTSGQWANGVLAGSWSKDSAAYIGEGAREAARLARIAALETELAAERGAIEQIDADLASVRARQDTLAAERAVPPDEQVRQAHTVAAERRRDLARLRTDHEEAVTATAARRADLVAAQARAAEFAADTGLPAAPGELAGVREGLAAYRTSLAALWPTARTAHGALLGAADALADLVTAREALDGAVERAAQAREAARGARLRFEELQATVGAAVEELQRRLAEAQAALERLSGHEQGAHKRERAAIAAQATADERRTSLRTQSDDAARERDEAVLEFRAFAATGVLAVALPALDIPDVTQPWAANPAVALARAANADLDAVDDGDGPWERLQKRVSDEHKTLSDAMTRHGHSTGMSVTEGVILVDVTFQSRRHDLPGLVAALAAEVEQRTALLSAREREILENHLLSEVAGTLHELIAEAEAEVRQMNDELESRPTSTGMKLRLTWRQARSAPVGLERVRGKLRQAVDAWTAADRALVGSFLQERIAAEHADNPAAGWTESLTTALDYRTWHEFAIERYSDGQWRPATGPASGGERALVVSIPLFAAASSHYKSAGNPYAPRLIALDEAFAGVDDDSRAKCLGLLATYDMDVVMTSEREWGCYPQVPGLGISQLARHDGIDAVLVTRWRWDGRERTRMDLREQASA